jgi:hypothetical protein
MTRNRRDAEFDAISERDIFEEAKDRLLIAESAESRNRQKAKSDLLFREGEQWDHTVVTTASQETPQLTINLTDALVQRVENNMREQSPRGKCHPVGEGATIELAEVINGVGRHVEYRSDASVAYDQGAKSAVTCGEGYWRLLAEYVKADSFQKELRIAPIMNIFTVYLDPGAIMPTGCDAMWGLITTKMKRIEYKRLYPRMDNADWTYGMVEDREKIDWESREEIRLAEYFRIREKGAKLYQIRNSLTGYEYTRYQDQMPNDESLAAAGDKVIDDRMSARRTVEWFRLNGTRVVEREVLPGTWIPIIRCQGNATNVDGDVIRRGMVRNMRDPQRMVNYGEVAKIKRLGLTPKAPWVAAEGQLNGHPEWYESNTSNHAVLEYKPVTVSTGQGDVLLPPPVRQPPAQMEAGFSEFTQGMRSNLLAVAGMPNEPGQDVQGQVISGRALKRRDKMSDQSHFQYYNNETLAIAHTWRIMLEWIPATYYEPGRIQRIIGEDHTPELITLNQQGDDPAVKALKNDLSVGRYDVVMDTGPGYETKREEGAETLIQLLSIGPLAELVAQHGADLVFRSIDHPYMQELADRIAALTPDGLKKVMESLPDQAKAIVQALYNENQQLKQQLQADQSGITKAKIAAQTKVHDTEVRAHTAEFDTKMRTHTAIAVEEIKAGASLLNTHAEAKHHMAEAERMIEHADKTEKTNGASGT